MSNEKLPMYGGQAIIEGVLMRGGKFMAAGMRSPEGNIVIQKEKLAGIYLSNIRKIPFLRGIIILWDALGIGLRYLTISANIQTGDEEKIEGPTFYLTLGFSLLLGVGLFFVLPAAIGKGIEVLFHWSAWWGNLLEGVFRLFILVGYIWSVGKIPEIKRVFSYHGAEHKTINAFEAGAVLIPENVQRYSREHPRCGTSFLLTVVFLSVILFSLFGPLPTALRLLSRVIFIPVLVVVAYEYIRWTANHLDSAFVRWLIRPNLAMQRLTTQEPSLDMLEVAIAAFNAMYEEEIPSIKTAITHQSTEVLSSAGADDYQNQ